MASLKEIQKLAITMYMADEDVKDIVHVTGKSERTIYRYIEQWKNKELDIDLSEVKKVVSNFKKEEALDILDILTSNSYSGKVKKALDLISEKELAKEIEVRGIRNVTAFIGTLIDKRLKSYSIELERENMKLKKELATNGRVIQFVGEEPVYEVSTELQENDITNIS